MASPKVKSWTFTSGGYPQTLKQTSTPAPTGSPGASQIYVKLHAAALNPVDIQIMNLPIWSIPLPFFQKEKSLAEDFAGEVIAAGPDSGFAVGDEVFGLQFSTGAIPGGCLTEVTVVDVPKAVVVKKPKKWTWEQGAALPLVWITARTTIEHATPWVENTREKKLAVLGGSSSTGMYAVHMARARGWKVLATCSGKNTEFVKGMGAHEVVDYTQQSVPEKVRAFKPDTIIDCVGGTECLTIPKRYLTIVGDKTTRHSMGGKLTYYWNPQMVLRWALGRLGLSGTVYDCVNIDFKKSYLEETLSLPLDKIVIDSEYNFNDVSDAYERLNTGRAKGKVVVKIGT